MAIKSVSDLQYYVAPSTYKNLTLVPAQYVTGVLGIKNWESGGTYTQGDVVFYDGNLYVAGDGTLGTPGAANSGWTEEPQSIYSMAKNASSNINVSSGTGVTISDGGVASLNVTWGDGLDYSTSGNTVTAKVDLYKTGSPAANASGLVFQGDSNQLKVNTGTGITISSNALTLNVTAQNGVSYSNGVFEAGLASSNPGLTKSGGLAVGQGTGISVSGSTVSVNLTRTAPIAGSGATISLNYGKGLDTLTESSTTKLIVKGYGKNITVDATNGVSATIPEWSGTNADYKVGDIVYRSNVIYRCSTANTNTSWTSSNWTAISSIITSNPTAVDSGGSGKQAKYVKTNTKKSSYGYIDDSLLPTFDGAGLVSVSSSENTTTGRTEYTIDVPSINITNVYTSTTQNARLSQEGIEKGDIFVETVSGTTTIYLCKNVSTAATDTVGAKASATSDWVTISNPSLSGYATQTYVQNYGYASSLGVTIGTGASETVASLDSHKLSFTIPSATDAAFGVVKVDNKTITATSGVITATIPSWAAADYAAGAVVTYNKLLYRAKNVVASSVTTNPASDTTNWEVITKDSNTTYSAATSGALGLVKIPAESTSYLNNDSGTIKVAVKTNGGIAYDSTANATGLYVSVDGSTIVNTSGTLNAAIKIWKSGTTYDVGDLVYYNNVLYKCWKTSATSGSTTYQASTTTPGSTNGNLLWGRCISSYILENYDSTVTTGTARTVGDIVSKDGMLYVSLTNSNGGSLPSQNNNGASNANFQRLVYYASTDKYGLVKIDGNTLTVTSATNPVTKVNLKTDGGLSSDSNGIYLTKTPTVTTWASVKSYNVGELVSYNGTIYECRSNNTSGDDNTPTTSVSDNQNTWWKAYNKFTGSISGTASNSPTQLTVTHNLNTQELVVQVYKMENSKRKPVLVDYFFGTASDSSGTTAINNNITFEFASPQTNLDNYQVVIIAAK